jgi:hypothetical protein
MFLGLLQALSEFFLIFLRAAHISPFAGYDNSKRQVSVCVPLADRISPNRAGTAFWRF